MALPDNYIDARIYFNDALIFLQEYDWIYKHSNTAFINAGVLESFPTELKCYFLRLTNEKLNEFPLLSIEYDLQNKNSPIHNFYIRLKKLIPAQAFNEVIPESSNPNLKLKKMNLKKQHEITKLADLIYQLCKNDTDLLIDFGAGLGYLSETLYTISKNKFLILGLEAEAERVETAQKRQMEFMPKAAKNILYKQEFINESSGLLIKTAITDLVEKHQKSEIKSAIIGLHACADLSITAINLFFEIGANLKRLIIMPCCYHKLKMDECTLKFHNFPLSQTLQFVVSQYENFENFLNRPFLRLACQQTLARWQNTTAEAHKRHGLDMFRRGIAEAIIDLENEYVVKKKIFNAEINSKGEETFSEFCRFYELRSKTTTEIMPWSSTHEAKFNEFQGKFGSEGYKLAEALTCLQTAMQRLCENIVLYDRLCYIQEYASANKVKINVRYEKLLDEKLSPRCYVLIAEKL